MRILTYLHSFEPGGVERIALRLVREWRAQGIDAPLLVGRDAGSMRSDAGAGLDAIVPEPSGLSRWETLWMILTLPRVLRAQRPDILFCAGNTYASIAIFLKLFLGRACPPIIAKVSNDLHRRDKPMWRRLLYRLYLRVQGRLFDRVVAMEQSAVAEISKHLALPADAVAVIPDPALSVDMIERIRAMSPPAETEGTGRRFVAVGRLAPQKNIALMLRAFAHGGSEGDTLTLIGDGPQRAGLEELAGRLGIGHRVSFVGYQSDAATLLAGFDILLLSSNYEGVPAIVLEALAARLPVIATDCSATMQTLLMHGRLGELVAVGDPVMLASAIARARPGRQDEALSRAQAERFTIERASGLYLQLARDLSPEVASPRILSMAS